MQAVMISIQPKWCELIASGKKTVEIRKTRPKIEVPFRVYIYQTLPKSGDWNEMDGHVIGEFVCDEIAFLNIDSVGVSDDAGYYLDERGWNPCLSREEIIKYCGIYRPYGWHISDIYIYDKPKSLSDFQVVNTYKGKWESDGRRSKRITRPFQSWGYVEELHDAD